MTQKETNSVSLCVSEASFLRSDDAKLIDNFVLKSDEKTRSSEEHPVSNMFTPILIAKTIRESS